MSFCVFVAGSVFVQYLKSRPDDTAVQSSLEFIVSALKAFTLKSPLSKSFLEQLSFDISGIELQKAGNPLGVDLSDRISLFKTVSTWKYHLWHLSLTPLSIASRKLFNAHLYLIFVNPRLVVMFLKIHRMAQIRRILLALLVSLMLLMELPPSQTDKKERLCSNRVRIPLQWAVICQALTTLLTINQEGQGPWKWIFPPNLASATRSVHHQTIQPHRP